MVKEQLIPLILLPNPKTNEELEVYSRKRRIQDRKLLNMIFNRKFRDSIIINRRKIFLNSIPEFNNIERTEINPDFPVITNRDNLEIY